MFHNIRRNKRFYVCGDMKKRNKTKHRSIHQIMNDVIGWLEEEQVEADFFGAYDVPEDISTFLFSDPTLARLSKKYQDASAQYEELCRLYGNDDPIVEVALVNRDSADTAMQTRLIELRENRRFVELARLCRLHEEEVEEERLHSAMVARMAQDHHINNNRKMAAQRARKRGETNFAMALFFLTLVENALKVASENLSLANAFIAVNGRDYKRACRAFGGAAS